MHNSIIRTIAFLAIMTFSASAYAQSVEVSGTVTDEAGPLIGATVMVKGTSNAAITDLDGKYSIKVNSGDMLVFSYIGYTDAERKVSSNAVIDVKMTADVAMLDQVVVLGYGAATKKKDLSAAVGIVAAPEQLAKRPVTSASAMLQGQVPGVTVEANGGDPTSAPKVVIRGQGSQQDGKDEPLWVVDGIPGAPINSVNDIESIVVLKDAASAAIYGATSGAGGVILVTTKKGQKGVSVSYDGLIGVRSAYNLPSALNAQEEIDMYKKAYAAAGQPLPDGWDVTKNPWVGTTRTNWFNEVFRNALYQRHNVVLNAGTEKFKNRMSFSAEDNDGIIVNTYNKQMGLNYRGEYQVNKWIKISEDFNWQQTSGKGADTNSGYTGVVLGCISMPASASMTPAHYDPVTDTYSYDPDFSNGYGGTAIEDPNYTEKYGNYAGIHQDAVNPYHELFRNDIYQRYSKLHTTTSLELGNFDKFKGFKFVSRFTYYTSNNFKKDFQHSRPEIGKPDLANRLTYNSSKDYGWKTENTITYDRTFGKHTVGALFSTTADYYKGRGFEAVGTKFPGETTDFQYFDFGEGYNKPTDYMTGPDANIAFIARLSYSYDDRYFVTASWRRDYAGRLPDNNNYGDFPAVTGAWKISSEHFFSRDVVSLLKIRASWGRVGNLGSIDRNYKSNTLSKKGWTTQSQQYGYESDAGYCGNFYYAGKALNNNLTWETSEQTDVGFDINFLNDRLTAGFDFYNKRTFNLIQDQSSGWPQSIGVDAMKVNLGEVTNRGVEMQLGWADRVGHWSYYVNGNAAYNKNWVSDIGATRLDGSKAEWTGGGSYRNIPYIYQTAEGEPLNSFYMIKCQGLFQSDEEAAAYVDKNGNRIQPNAKGGDLKFEDYNGDGKIDSKDRQYCGNAVPDWTFGLNAGFTWKDLSFSMQFYGVQGAQAANVAKFSTLNAADRFNKDSRIMNYWTPENKGSNIPRLCSEDPNQNFSQPSTWYLEDASYIRCKNVTVSYDFSNLIRKSSHLLERGSALMLYVSGENLFTITKYSGMDPECGGWDAMKYPVSRVFSLGIKLTY